MKKSILMPRPIAAALVAAACAAATPAMAAGEAGLRVTRDAETGQLRAPTVEENRALDAAAASLRKAAGKSDSRAAAPIQTTHANGAVEVQLGDDSLMYSVARVNAQGKLERVCVQGVEASRNAMKGSGFASATHATRVALSARQAKATKEPLDEK